MKIATFNANSIRSRSEVLLKWLDAHKPDILAVQETKVQDIDFPLDTFSQTGYHIIYKGQKRYNGVAIFSKEKPKNVMSELSADPTNQARFLKANIGSITLINTYIPQGNAVGTEQFEYKLKWFQWLLEYFQNHHKPTDPIIWVGDFNIAFEDIDVHDPQGLRGHVCFCEPVQQSLLSIIRWGFVDIFRARYPDKPDCYTFWDYRVPNALKRNIGWRLDYIMATGVLADCCRDCRIDVEPRGWDRPSDHTFLIAEFNI